MKILVGAVLLFLSGSFLMLTLTVAGASFVFLLLFRLIQPLLPVVGNWIVKKDVKKQVNLNWQCPHQIRDKIAKELGYQPWTISLWWVQRHLNTLRKEEEVEAELLFAKCSACPSRPTLYREYSAPSDPPPPRKKHKLLWERLLPQL